MENIIEKEKSAVAVCPCNSYDPSEVYAAVKACTEALGGMKNMVSLDERVLVKPNFLYPADANRCITTNPAVISAVLRLLSEAGCTDVKYGDSPANGSCRDAAAKLGLSGDNQWGAELADMSEEKTVDFPSGSAAKQLHLTREAAEADCIIGVCKMKTHALERITGAVKNMYGLICGYRKAAGHVSFPNAVIFADMLSDIHRCTNQRLHIMDGVVAMEGNGPASGTPVNMNVILVSRDPVALDSVFCRLINLDPKLVPTNTRGSIAGIGTYRAEDIRLLLCGPEGFSEVSFDYLISNFGKPDFDVQRDREKLSVLSLWSRLTSGKGGRPVIDPGKCVRCGACVNHCPVEGGAVNFKKGRENPPVYDYRKCIGCFCCQEICPAHAIGVKR